VDLRFYDSIAISAVRR